MTRLSRFPALGLILGALLGGMVPLSGCMKAYRQSIGNSNLEQVFARVYLTDLNTSWQSVLEALKSLRLDVSNRESGFVQTKWTENTSEKNFVDSFGAAGAYLKAQYRFRVSVAKGFFNGKPSIKVSVQKEQLVQRDVLEGWRPIETDGVEENTLLYRIGRIISMRMRLMKIEEERTQQAIEESQF